MRTSFQPSGLTRSPPPQGLGAYIRHLYDTEDRLVVMLERSTSQLTSIKQENKRQKRLLQRYRIEHCVVGGIVGAILANTLWVSR